MRSIKLNNYSKPGEKSEDRFSIELSAKEVELLGQMLKNFEQRQYVAVKSLKDEFGIKVEENDR